VLDFFEEAGRHSWPLQQAISHLAAQPEPGVLVLLNCAAGADRLFEQLQHRQPKAGASSALRNYGLGASILRDLDVRKMTLLAQPRKMPSMAGFGLEVLGYRQPD
jgi:3,4-dihydroxy 2-butanone 4-phosphate synthase/GTP cyclohydrolase II